MHAPLTDRERQVLGAVIEAYVQTAEPAASRTIAKRLQLGLSPATIRNTMSDLEEKGFLYHPHTSAGRGLGVGGEPDPRGVDQRAHRCGPGALPSGAGA